MKPIAPPVGLSMSEDVEVRVGVQNGYRARVRWFDPTTKRRRSKSDTFSTDEEARAWIAMIREAAARGVDPQAATMTLVDYGTAVQDIAMRGLEGKTLYPYLAGWRLRVVPTLGHLPVRMITYGVVDRAVHSWIGEGCGRSTVKNSLAALVRILEQAVRDGIIDRNPARVTGWQREYQRTEDELDDPRSLALPDWQSLTDLANSLVARSADHFAGWGDVVIFAACTAARIGEVSGVRVGDIDLKTWTWTVRRQTTPSPGGLIDKGTKGKRSRKVPLIVEVRELVRQRVEIHTDPNARLFTGPRGGPITTAVLRDATHWDEVVTKLGHSHLRRHDLRHTGLTWMADAGVPLHVLRKIAGHGSLSTTQRYLHPDAAAIASAGDSLTAYLGGSVVPKWSQAGPRLRVVDDKS